MSSKRADKFLFRYLDTNGDGTGTTSAIADYSAGEEFYLTDASNILHLHRMVVYIEDSAASAYNKYGALAALTNGIAVKITDSDDVTLRDLTGGSPVKTSGQWSRLCYDVAVLGNSTTVRWTFSKSGAPITLFPGDKLVVTITDDLQGLDDHTFQVQGVYGGLD